MSITRKVLLFLWSCILTGVMASVANASPIMPSVNVQVTPWLAPNAFGSPSFSGAVSNEEYALLHGLSSYGTPGTPTYFQARSNVTSAQAIVTGFPSWMGKADPGNAFGPAFSHELGNRMHFGLLATGVDGAMFNIAGMSMTMTSTDPGHGLNYTFASGYTYSPMWEGILYGPNGVLGGGDDTYITSGPATQMVNAIVGRGSGNSFAAYCSSCTIAQQQTAIDSAAAYPGSPFNFTGTYSFTNSDYMALGSGSGTFHVGTVPAPSTIALIPLSLMCMWFFRKKHNARNQLSLTGALA